MPKWHMDLGTLPSPQANPTMPCSHQLKHSKSPVGLKTGPPQRPSLAQTAACETFGDAEGGRG